LVGAGVLRTRIAADQISQSFGIAPPKFHLDSSLVVDLA